MRESFETSADPTFLPIAGTNLLEELSELVENFEEFNGSEEYRESQFCRQSIWIMQDNRRKIIKALKKNNKKYLLSVCAQLLRFVFDIDNLEALMQPSLPYFTSEISEILKGYFLTTEKPDIENSIYEMRQVFHKYRPA